MDVLCDNLMVEEVLPRMQPMDLLRLRAASRRYNALVLRPDFAARYWQRAGVFVQPMEEPKEAVPIFLAGPGAGGNPTKFIMPGADLAFLPPPSAEEENMMKHSHEDPEGIAILHSAAGLLLCCRGRSPTVCYYVCNPVTWQYVALPKLPALSYDKQCRCGLLTVTDGMKSFQVSIVHFPELHEEFLKLSVFSSDTGQWEDLRKLALPNNPDSVDYDTISMAPMLGQSGTSYWIHELDEDYAIAYNSSSVNNSIQAIALPQPLVGRFTSNVNRCIGERHGGGLQYAQSNTTEFEVWKSDIIGGKWRLWVKVSVVRIMEQNPGAAAFLCNKSSDSLFKPVGFHPTDEDVVFVALPGAVFAYSIQHGTMNLQCTLDCLAVPAEVYQYVHPAYPVEIPAIKDPNTKEPRRKRGYNETDVNGEGGQRKSLREQVCPTCPLCDQHQESIQHILLQCVVARDVWYLALRKVGLQDLAPGAEDTLAEWWRRGGDRVPREKKKGFNTLVILVAWSLWKQRNRCVFDNTQPTVQAILRDVADKTTLLRTAAGVQERGLLQ